MVLWAQRHVVALWVVCVLSIIVLSLIPPALSESDIGKGLLWKNGHVLAYALFVVISVMLFSRDRLLMLGDRLMIYAGIATLGASIEIVQPFFGRHGNIRDVALDLLGIAIGAVSEALLARLR